MLMKQGKPLIICIELIRKNTHYGKNSFQIQGSTFMNRLKNNDIYNNAPSKSNFLEKYKKSIIDLY